jgi:bile acid:Na+ symporter, BASS family
MTSFVNGALSISVMLLLFGVGLNTPFLNVVAVARQYRLVLRGLLANFVLVPVLFTFALKGVSLGPDVVIGLLVLAAVPIAPLAPPFVGMAKGDVAYAVGLMVIAAVLGLFLTPLILALALPASEAGLHIDVVRILQTLLVVQLIPLGVGMAINGARPAWAEKLLRVVPKLGRIGVLFTLTLIASGQAEQIVGLGVLPHAVSLVGIVGCLLIGDWVMRGKADEIRRSLAVSTAIRNAALALLIVNTNLPGTQAVTIVFVFGLWSLAVAYCYGKLSKAVIAPTN